MRMMIERGDRVVYTHVSLRGIFRACNEYHDKKGGQLRRVLGYSDVRQILCACSTSLYNSQEHILSSCLIPSAIALLSISKVEPRSTIGLDEHESR